jgi:periplasmic divalent cation tolerance protein
MESIEMKWSTYAVLFITTASDDEARQISRALLEQRKAACVNIIAKVDSLFRWEDKLDSAQEKLLIVKTKTSLLPEIINLVKKMHRYSVPEIIAMPIIGGNEDYLEWIEKSAE